MYFLYLVGPLVEQVYGSARFLLLYVLTAATASLASYLLGGLGPSVGASGALFGLCGVLLVGRVLHRPALQGQQRALMSQIGGLVVINLVLGFGLNSFGGNIDNFAHLGGLAGGLWLGLLIPPIGAARSPGSRPPARRRDAGLPHGPGQRRRPERHGGRPEQMSRGDRGGLLLSLVRWTGVAALVVVVFAGVVLGAGKPL